MTHLDLTQQKVLRWCLAQTTLSMAQPSEMETRLRAVLRRERRETMTRRKMMGGVLTTIAVIGPLAFLRPVAMASTGVKPHPNLKHHLADMNTLKDKDFRTEVHAYDLNLARLYVAFAVANGQYVKAIKNQRPAAIASLIAPGYTLNGKPMSAAEAVSALRRWMHQSPGGPYQTIFTNATLQGAFAPGMGSKPADWHRWFAGAKILTVGKEKWNAGAHGSNVIFLRRDVWINTPKGLRLQQTQVSR